MTSKLFGFLLFGSLIIVILTNDSARREITIPIGNYHLIERDVLFLPLMFYSIINWKKIAGLVKKAIFRKYVFTIAFVYFAWTIYGLLNGNEIGNIGYALRQVIYVFIYFPLLAYLNSSPKCISKIKSLLQVLFYISIVITIVLSIIYFGSAGYEFRGMFFWVDDPSNSGTYLRVLVAGALYFPLILFLCFTDFWGKNKFVVMIFSIIGLLLTFTRSYWLGTIIGVIFFLIVSIFSQTKNMTSKKTLLLLLSIISVIMIIFVLFPEFRINIVHRFLSSENLESGAIIYRIEEAASFISKIALRPILGYGTGATVLTVDAFNSRLLFYTSFSHNSYLIYLLYFGIVGTMLLLISYYKMVSGLVYLFRRSKIIYASKYFLSLASSIIALLTLSLTASQLTFAGGYFQLGIILAMADSQIIRACIKTEKI